MFPHLQIDVRVFGPRRGWMLMHLMLGNEHEMSPS
jgi:hypothetical protein